MKDLSFTTSCDFPLNSSLHWDHGHTQIQPAWQGCVRES